MGQGRTPKRTRPHHGSSAPSPGEPTLPLAAPAPVRPREAAPRRVFLTGATGFVGREVRRQLLAAGWEVVAIARHMSAATAAPGVIQVAADINGDAWPRWCEGCTAAIHLVGIIRELPSRGVTFDRVHREATERVVAACRELGISRLVHMSALGARRGALTGYQRTKWAAEEAVRASGLTWTILRPSVIFGPGDGFTTSLVAPLKRAPFFPVFGDGSVRLQPIAVSEVARAFVRSLDAPASVSRVIEMGGPEALTYDELLRRTAGALGRRPVFVHLAPGLSRALVAMLQLVPGAPITRDQLTMLFEGSTCDPALSAELFGPALIRFEGPTWLKP